MARPNRKLSSIVKILMFLVLWIGVLLSLRGRHLFVEERTFPLNLGIENAGIQIELVEPISDSLPNPLVIGVKTPTTRFRLKSLTSLRGLVHIREQSQVLRFVRLRTSRDYCYAWQEQNSPQEIVSFSQCQMPEFADTGSPPASLESGRYGVLSDAAYRIGKFEPTKITEADGVYCIVRWVCIYDGLEGKAVQQWQERVTPEGGYQCIILKSLPPPKLPKTEWYIYGLM